MALDLEDAQTQQPDSVSRKATLIVFPVTIKVPVLIVTIKCDSILIALLLCCGKSALPTE